MVSDRPTPHRDETTTGEGELCYFKNIYYCFVSKVMAMLCSLNTPASCDVE